MKVAVQIPELTGGGQPRIPYPSPMVDYQTLGRMNVLWSTLWDSLLCLVLRCDARSLILALVSPYNLVICLRGLSCFGKVHRAVLQEINVLGWSERACHNQMKTGKAWMVGVRSHQMMKAFKMLSLGSIALEIIWRQGKGRPKGLENLPEKTKPRSGRKGIHTQILCFWLAPSSISLGCNDGPSHNECQ